MARVQLSYPGYGISSIDMAVPQYGDSVLDKRMTEEEYYAKKFPVLWLLHGGYGCSSDWFRFTEIEKFAADKRLFVVSISGENGCYVDMERGNQWESLLTDYVWDMVHELFPMASEDPEDNYIAGLSMGGYGALRNGLAHPEKYSVIGSFSGAPSIAKNYAEDPEHLKALQLDWVFGDQHIGTMNDPWYSAEALAKSGKKLPPIYLSCGTADGLYADNVAYRAHLEKLGYTVTWDEDGSGHEWGFWNRQVGKFIEEMVK